MIHFRLLVLALFVGAAKADGWDDFTNNLATDLAPLLALFGEQVTKQFLSESTSNWDSFIFAMAPMGILTALVSAIRVCGGPSLRAFIGRAQEGGGIAEAELCSSTSRDVCELYHNGAIVRVFGRPKILEIVHNPHLADFSGEGTTSESPKYGIYTFQEYVEYEQNRSQQRASENGHWKPEWKEVGNNMQADSEYQQSRNKTCFAPNPNLSFNIGMRRRYMFVTWFAAVIGFLAQSSVVVFGAVVTYLLAWKKDDQPPPSWSFPLMSIGTLLLCSGMFYCAFLVETSTKERFWRRPTGKDTTRSTLYVVQPGNQIIGDQTFDSFAFSDSGNPLEEYTTSWKSPRGDTGPKGIWFAIGVTMSGFILQFVGLRAMHSAVSLLQLGVILLMSGIRAGLRTRRLREEDNIFQGFPNDVEGFELDWLALQLSCEPRDGTMGFWSVIGPQEDNRHDNQQDFNKDKPLKETCCGLENTSTNNAEIPLAIKTFYYRCRLAEMTSQPTRNKSKLSRRWEEPLVHVRQHARQLKNAIESAATILINHANMKPGWEDPIPWMINTLQQSQGTRSDTSKCSSERSFRVQLALIKLPTENNTTPPVFQIKQQHLEAVLGLWTWSMASEALMNIYDNEASKASTSIEGLGYRILVAGKDLNDIQNGQTEINFWAGESPMAGSVQRWGEVPVIAERHPGFLWKTDRKSLTHKATPYQSPSPLRSFGWQSADIPANEMVALVTETTDKSLAISCAHEIYQSFFCTIMVAFHSIGGTTELHKGSRGLYLTNQVLSSLVKSFRESGLGSSRDAHEIIIPALRYQSKLPVATDVLPVAHAHAEELRKKEEFQRAEDILKWALQIAKATRDDLGTSSSDRIPSTFLELYELYSHSLDVLTPDSRGRTVLSWAAQQGWVEVVKAILEIGTVVDSEDDWKRTPLSYAAEYGHTDIIRVLIGSRALPVTQDIDGRSPFSYAAAGGWVDVMNALVCETSVALSSWDRSRQSPLHWAAKSGHVHAVEWLLQQNVKINDVDAGGLSPLMAALLNRQEETAEVLLKNKADIHIPINGVPSWLWAVNEMKWDSVKYILKFLNKRTMVDTSQARQRRAVVFVFHQSPYSLDTTAEVMPEKDLKIYEGFNRKRISVTEDVIESLAVGGYVVTAFLFEQIGTSIRSKVLEFHKKHELPSFDLLLEYFDDKVELRQKFLNGVAQNTKNGIEILEPLLSRGGDRFKITEDIVNTAAGNEVFVQQMMKLLLNERGNEFEITEEILKSLMQNEGDTLEVARLLFDERGYEFKITEDVVVAAAGNDLHAPKLLKLLLDERGYEFKITENIMTAAVGTKSKVLEVYRLLRDKIGDEVKITKHVMVAAVRNSHHEGSELVKLLLDESGHEFKIREDIMVAAAGNLHLSLQMFRILLNERGYQFKITEHIVSAAAGAKSHVLEIFDILLNERGHEFKITERVMAAAVRNISGRGLELTKLLLDKRGHDFRITEDIITAAAGTECRERLGLIKLLLGERGHEFKIKEETMVAAVRSRNGDTQSVVRLFIDERGHKIKITEHVVEEALVMDPGYPYNTYNGRRGLDMLEMFVNERGSEFKVTENMVKAATRHGKYSTTILQILFNKAGSELRITDDIIKYAIGNEGFNAEETLLLLLEKRGNRLKITGDIIEAATRNRWHASRVKQLFDCFACLK